MRRLPLSLLSVLALAGCAGGPEIIPQAAPPVPVPTPSPTPTPAPPPLGEDWRDWPMTPGDWRYRREGQDSVAAFGAAGQAPELTLRCERPRGRIVLARRGSGTASLSVRTSSMVRQVAVRPEGGYLAAELAARDSLIDAMGFSRGRFVVQGAGLPVLVAPAWAEILRVAEDCR